MRLFVAAGIAVLLAAAIAAGQTPATRQQPTFKAGVNFVRVDVYPTMDGRAISDLTQGDFQVFEDGVPQRIETFERITVRLPGAPAERAEPSSVDASNDAAADPRSRLFVLFLDTFHTPQDRRPDGTSLVRPSTPQDRAAAADTPPPGAGRITHALVGLLERPIGPDDLLGICTPEMRVEMVTFTRRPASIEAILEKAPWQRLGAFHDRDAREQMYYQCYARQDPDLFVETLIARRREMLALGALRDLLIHLQNIREERKAILLVSQGWNLFGPVPSLASPVDGRVPGAPQVGVPPVGAPPVEIPRPPVGVPRPPRVGVPAPVAVPHPPPVRVLRDETDPAVLRECDRDRAMLASLDDGRDFRDILNAAARANVTFYPIDPRGLSVPMGVAGARILDRQHETLRQLALVTDGIAVVDSNDLDGRVRRIVDDLSSYYLIGYNSTNTRFDGKFRTIRVQVKRRGVTVRARPGYTAPTEAEVAARATPAPPLDREVDLRDKTLSTLGAWRADVPFRAAAGYGFARSAADGEPPARVMWIVGELDGAAARTAEWSEGGEATITVSDKDGKTAATARAAVAATTPFLLQLLDTPLKAADYLVKVRLRGKSASAGDAATQVRVVVPNIATAAGSVGSPVLYRRGPLAGAAFQPTADLRFRKAERIRVDVPLAAPVGSVAAQLLDRRGQPLPIPIATGQREDSGRRFATVELALAPLAPADYLVEVSVRRGEKTEKMLTAFRIVP